jgi:hypothetical protein
MSYLDTPRIHLNPRESGTVTLYATAFGKPLRGLDLPIGFDDPQLDHANSPPTAIRFPNSVTTQPSRRVASDIAAGAPRPLPERRSFINSQVYFLSASNRTLIQAWIENGCPRGESDV